MDESHYRSWLAKQAAMGRKIPDTTAPHFAPPGTGKTVFVDEPGNYMGIQITELLGNG